MSLPLSTTLHLARTRTPADRSRVRLATAALAFSGALVIDAVRIHRMGPGDLSYHRFSNYVAEAGLRAGLSTILVILAILAGGLAVQALRIGTAARERRLAALRLAGASRAQVRRLATADAALVGLTGGLLAGPFYVGLTLLFSVLPRMTRVFPDLSLRDVVVWVLVTGLLTVGGAAIGHIQHRDPSVEARRRNPMPTRVRLIMGLALVVAGLAAAPMLGYIAAPLTIVGLATLWVAVVPLVIQATGRWLGASGDPAQLLTGARLITDARPAGRMSTLLLCCAFVVGSLVQVSLYMVTRSPGHLGGTLAFYLTGFAMSAFGMALIAVISLCALTVGVADQIVDQRRQLACLTAMGVDVGFLRRVVRGQIATVAAPALMLGSVLGVLIGPGGLIGFHTDRPTVAFLVTGLVAVVLLSWVVATAGATLAAYLLRYQLRDALDPENLRAA
jgi:hypothetical protein